METPPIRPAVGEMVAMDVEADLAELRQPIAPAPVAAAAIEQLLTASKLLKTIGVLFEKSVGQGWKLTYQHKTYDVTFYPEVLDELPSPRLMNFGEPLFDTLIKVVLQGEELGQLSQ